MRRCLFTAAAALSLVLCVATVVGGTYSYRATPAATSRWIGPAGATTLHYYRIVGFVHGWLVLEVDDWTVHHGSEAAARAAATDGAWEGPEFVMGPPIVPGSWTGHDMTDLGVARYRIRAGAGGVERVW